MQAIFELSRGEQDLIEDLQLARKVGTHCGLALVRMQMYNMLGLAVLLHIVIYVGQL